MQVFEAPDDNAQVRGAAVLSIIEGVPDAFTDRAREILADHGIEELSEDDWYSMQAYLDAYETIIDNIGEATLKQIGETTPKTAEWPPYVETPFEALDSIDDAYNMNHRGGDVGYYDATEIDETTARVECYTPYPCSYEEALVKGTAAQFTSGRVDIEDVSETTDDPRCTFEVSW